MKINEVEALAGITKKNIRFYEEQGLLSPKRNSENGYRDYGEEEVQTLRRIKLLRKLGVPIEEIRQMMNGTHTVGDGMRRHLVTLERENRNLQQSILLCQQMQNMDIAVTELDTEEILSKMEEMERMGANFQNKQTQDVRVHYVAPVVVTVIMIGIMLGIAMLMVWAYTIAPEEAPPAWIIGILVGICLAVCGGILLALIQRIREIGRGEMDAARYY